MLDQQGQLKTDIVAATAIKKPWGVTRNGHFTNQFAPCTNIATKAYKVQQAQAVHRQRRTFVN